MQFAGTLLPMPQVIQRILSEFIPPYLISGLRFMMIARQDIQELSIRFRVTSIPDLVYILDGWLDSLTVESSICFWGSSGTCVWES